MDTRQISDLFCSIGLNPGYKGYPYLIHVVELAAAYSGQPFPCLKDLYQQTAEHFHVTPTVITDNIRTLLRSYWNNDGRNVFSIILHYPVKDRLTVKEFVAVVAEYLGKL